MPRVRQDRDVLFLWEGISKQPVAWRTRRERETPSCLDLSTNSAGKDGEDDDCSGGFGLECKVGEVLEHFE